MSMFLRLHPGVQAFVVIGQAPESNNGMVLGTILEVRVGRKYQTMTEV